MGSASKLLHRYKRYGTFLPEKQRRIQYRKKNYKPLGTRTTYYILNEENGREFVVYNLKAWVKMIGCSYDGFRRRRGFSTYRLLRWESRTAKK